MRTDHDSWDINTSVGITALGVAAGRAVETNRPDGLISDPYAEAFVRSAGSDIPLPTSQSELDDSELGDLWQQMSDYMAVRTRFFDDYFTAAAREQVEQAVILAAGLDTRPYRITLPPHVFEIDQPQVLEFKDKVLADNDARSRGERTAVPVDLRDDWPASLLEAGFTAGRSTAWLAEGLMPYLPADARADLFSRVDALSGPGSRISIEHIAAPMEAFADHPMLRKAQDAFNMNVADLFYDEQSVEPQEWLTAAGWTVQDYAVNEVAQKYGRPLHELVEPIMGGTRFVVATKN